MKKNRIAYLDMLLLWVLRLLQLDPDLILVNIM